MQIILLGNDQYGREYSFATHAGYRRFVSKARRQGWQVVATSWDHLRPSGGQVVAVRGVVRGQGDMRPISEPLVLRPDYIWDGTLAGEVAVNRFNRPALAYMIGQGLLPRLALGPNPLGLKGLAVDSGNRATVLEWLEQGMLPIINTGSLPISIRYLPHLVERYWPGARYSRSALFGTMGKLHLEECLLRAEAEGAIKTVPRAATILARTQAELRAAIGGMLEEKPRARIIVKDSGGTRLEGIYLVDGRNREEQLASMDSSPGSAWLVQPYLTDTVLFQGRKADVRIFVGVFSWKPLVYRIYRGGMTRVAWPRFIASAFPDPDNCLTTRRGYHTLAEYFQGSFACRPSEVWAAVEDTISNTLAAVMQCYGDRLEHLKAVVEHLGFDLMFTEEAGEPRALLVEINHMPMLYSDKVARDHAVNLDCDAAHGAFFADYQKLIPRS